MNFPTLKTTCLALASCAALAACDETVTQTAGTTSDPEPLPLASALGNSGNQKVIQAMDICLDNFPNMLDVRNGLRQSNFKSEIRRGGTEYFSAFNRNIIAFTSIGTNEPTCGFGRTGLRDEEAVLVATSILSAKYGSSLYEFDFSQEDGWLAAFYAKTDSGTEVDIFVRRQISVPGVYRGSLIYVYEHIEPEE